MTKHDRRMWDLRYKPHAYEYKVEPAPLPEMVVHDEKPGVGLLLLAFLSAIIDLPVSEGSSIERRVVNTNAPEFAPQNEDSEA